VTGIPALGTGPRVPVAALSRLGEVRLGAECAEEGFGRKFGALPTRSGSGLAVMVWNFEDGMEAAGPAATARLEALAERGANGNHQVFLSWSPSLDEDFLFYRLWRRTGPGGECRLLREEDSFNTGVHVDMEVEPGRSYAYRVQAVNASLQAGELSAEVEVMLPASW